MRNLIEERWPNRVRARIQEDESGCWIWQGSFDQNGYGQISKGKTCVAAHRAVYELFVGPIPEGLVLDHLCRVPACVNPRHLDPVTMRINTLRGVSIVARNAAKTHCLRGHPFDRPYEAGNPRKCHTCRIDRQRLSRARRRGATQTVAITESLHQIDFAVTRLTSDVEHLTGREAVELAREVTLRIRRLNGLCGSLRRQAA